MSTRLVSLVRSLAAALLISLALVRPAAAVDFTDIWWNSLESGWGANMVQADNFVFVTFFIDGPNNQPIWYTGNMTVDVNGVWSGPLYFTTGTYFGNPWNPAQVTQTQVGTVTFTPANAYSGTLTYNVGTCTSRSRSRGRRSRPSRPPASTRAPCCRSSATAPTPTTTAR